MAMGTDMDFKLAQDAQYLDKDWWRWSVKLEGPNTDLEKVDHVVYNLHETFPNPVRRVKDTESHFKIEAEGWGGFMVYATVVLKDGTEQHLEHDLELLYPSGKRTEK